MWCAYTCSPVQSTFVQAVGYSYAGAADGYYYAVDNFTVDPFYACTMFTSCVKTTFIAEASLQSSEAFLDFLGLNGKDTGKSIISFNFNTNHSISLLTDVYDCSYNVPSDGKLENYTGIHNCSCSFCDSSCAAPNVNGDIGFFDGCDGELVAIVYAILVLFSIVLFVFRSYLEKKH
jgi:hypothetical protein